MQGGKDSKVISLFGSRKSALNKTSESEVLKGSVKNHASSASMSDSITENGGESTKESFSDVMRRNLENAERMRQERLKANKSVLRSYNIKD